MLFRSIKKALKITELIAERRMSYKMIERDQERFNRINLKGTTRYKEYANTIINDAIKYDNYLVENRKEILGMLGIDYDSYNQVLKKYGNVLVIEEDYYNEHLRSTRTSNHGQKLIEKAEEITKLYIKRLNFQLGYFTTDKIMNEALKNYHLGMRIIAYIPKMLALDDIYMEYNLSDPDFDFIIELGGDTPDDVSGKKSEHK